MDLAAVSRWIDGWALGWATHDVELIASLYTDDARQRSEPFRERDVPRRYAAWAFADEAGAEVWFAEPHSVGDETAACEWWAISTLPDGRTVTLAGVSLLHFAPDGRVDDQRDYWSERSGSHAPPEGWGPIAARR
jgi:SnoaL-like protein